MDELTNALDIAANSLSLTERGWRFFRRIPLPRLGSIHKSSGGSELRSSITAPDGTSWQIELRSSDEQVRNALAIAKQTFEMLGSEDFPADDLDEEWQDRFWDDAKRKYTQDAQSIYASILAGELRQPGSYSKKALSVLDDLNEETARTFKRYCTLAARFGNVTALMHQPPEMDCMNNKLQEFGITYIDIGRLAEHGLVRDSSSEIDSKQFLVQTTSSGRTVNASFTISGVAYALELVSDNDFRDMSIVMATRAGHELARIVEPSIEVKVEAYTSKLFGEIEKKGAKVVPVKHG